MKFFLHLKRWPFVIFFIVILFGIPFINVVSKDNISASTIMLICYTGIIALIYFVIFGWFYSVGVNLYKKLPPNTGINLKRFKKYFFITLICCLLVGVIFIKYFTNLTSGNTDFSTLPFIILLAFVSMFCFTYCIYFIAKSLKIVELQKHTSDNLEEFILLCIFPIGLWFIQPRINSIFKNEK